MSQANFPLDGVRVLDLSRVLAGPICCQLLADLGADVVKVERPGTGDDTRSWGPPFAEDGTSAYFMACNRRKRSLALDLGHPRASPLLGQLIERADILVENFLPATLVRLGLTPAELARRNPRLVSCSISGYGRTGPWADRPGYDLAIQASSGLMSITGEPQGQPMKVGVALTDVVTGLYAAASALAGLYARGNQGSGRAFDLALADCTLAGLVNVAQAALVTGCAPQRWGNAHAQIVPYEVFRTRDGHLALAIGNDTQWRRFCEGVGQPAWADDPQLATNPSRVAARQRVVSLVSAALAAHDTGYWLERLGQWQVPHAPVLGVDEALALEQTQARGMVAEATDASGRRFRLLASPVHWSGEPPRRGYLPPGLGQHTDEVLTQWLAYEPTAIARLRAEGVVA